MRDSASPDGVHWYVKWVHFAVANAVWAIFGIFYFA